MSKKKQTTKKAARKSAAPAPVATTTPATQAPVIAKQVYPIVVRNQSAHALAVCEMSERVTLIGLFGDACYDVRTIDLDTFKREWVDVEFSGLGKKIASVESYLDTIAKSTLGITPGVVSAIMHLKEAAHDVVYVSKAGVVTKVAKAAAVELSGQRDTAGNVAALVAVLSEAALASFVVAHVEGAPKKLRRVKASDPRIVAAVERVVPRTQSPVAKMADVIAAKGATATQAPQPGTSTGRATSTRVSPSGGATRKRIGVKRLLHDLLVQGTKGTLAQLCKATGGTEASVRTALSDLKNPKYGIDGKALPIGCKDGVYGLDK